MNSVYGYRGYYSYYGEVRLGHSFFLGPIGLRTFFSLGRGRVFPWDVLSLGRIVLGHFVHGTFCLGPFLCGSGFYCYLTVYDSLLLISR